MRSKKTYDLTKPEIRKQFITTEEAMELYSLGFNKLKRCALKADAIYQRGTTALINCERFEAYLENFRHHGEFETIAQQMVPTPLRLEEKTNG